MSCSGQQKKYLAKKTVAIFAGAMMLFAMTFSLFYLAIETQILPVVFLIEFFLYETPVSKKIRLNN